MEQPAINNQWAIPLYLNPSPPESPNNALIGVSVGNSPFHKLVFDTGSIGVLIARDSIGKDVRITNIPFKRNYPARTIEGYIGYGPVTLENSSGEQITLPNFPLLIANGSSVPMPGGIGNFGASIKAQMVNGVYIYSFFSALSYGGDLKNGFITRISDSAVKVGLTKQDIESFTSSTKMKPGKNNGQNFPVWNDRSLSNCYSIENTKFSDITLSTIFDTGGENTHFFVNQDLIPSAVHNGVLEPGESFQAKVFDLPELIWQYTSGEVQAYNRILFYSDNEEQWANMGFRFFRDYYVMFNVADGVLGILSAK